MNNTDKQAYDRAVTMFSPDGRLHQVEYARKAVKQGSPVAGVQTEEGIVFIAKTQKRSPLVVSESIEKLHKVDNCIGAATAGHATDGRVLVDKVRVYAEQDKVRFGEDATIDTLTQAMADHLQQTTQRGGMRPYGTALLIGGYDDVDGMSMYQIDPSGTPTQWRAHCIGEGSEDVRDHYEENYTETMSLDDAINMTLEAFSNIGQTPDAESIDIAMATEESYNRLSTDEIEEYTQNYE